MNRIPKQYPCILCEKTYTGQLIRQIHILFQRRFRRVSSVHFQALIMQKLSSKYFIKRITTHDNGNAQSHYKVKSKLNNTIIANSDAHTLTHDKIIKSPFNKNNIATIKTNKILTKVLLVAPPEQV